jgi:predicted Zn-dependent peptidase
MDYTLTRLANGLDVVSVVMPGAYSVAITLFVRVGSRDERPEEAGSAHLIEHMLFKGTPARPHAELISEAIEREGGILNAATDKEETVYWVRVRADRADFAANLLADMVLHSTFPLAEVGKEKKVIAEELAMSMDTPQDWVHTMIDEACWPGTSLSRDVAGSKESVAGLSRAPLLAFREQFYQPHEVTVAVAGPLTHEAAVHLVETEFGSWRPGPADGRNRNGGAAQVLYAVDVPKLRYLVRDTEQINLCLAVAGVSRNSPDRYALDLLTTLLGGAMSSRLFSEVRERRGLAYDIHSYTNKFAETGSLVTYAAIDPENIQPVLEQIILQLDRFRREPVPDTELDKAKEYSKGRLLLGLEDTQSVGAWCGGQQSVYGTIRSPEAVCAALSAVTNADIPRVASMCVRNEYLRLAAIGPRVKLEPVEALLQL